MDLPNLRERRADIPLLVDHMFRRLSATRETKAYRVSEEAMEVLLNYDYPGNVRELENILEHALIICQDEVIEPKHLPAFLREDRSPDSSRPETSGAAPFPPERERILEVLKRHHWRRGEAARELQMDRTTLWRKMKRYRLQP
jgi:DNA-binding NtrC family response regulator